jgi:GAF domain-containing protein
MSKTFWRTIFWPDFANLEDQIAIRKARGLNILLVLLVPMMLVSAMVQWQTSPEANKLFNLVTDLGYGLFAILLIYWLRRGHLQLVSRIVVAIAYLASTLPVMAYADLNAGVAIFSYLVSISMAVYLLAPWEILVFFFLLAASLPIIQMGIDNGVIVRQLDTPPPSSVLSSYFTIMTISGTLFFIASETLNRSLKQERESALQAEKSRKEAEQINATLEERIAERTRELSENAERLKALQEETEKRAGYLQAIAEITRAALQTSESIQRMLPRVADLIHQHFGFYHIGIFLVDPNNQYAVLQAVNSQSKGGQRMLERGHKLFIGQLGIVGNVAATGLPRIALDTTADAVFFNNPDLPETRSEMALPLIIGRRIIGVLDIQSKHPNAFTEEDIEVFRILTEQIAYAIANTQRLEKAERLAREAAAVYAQNLQEAWQMLSKRQRVFGIENRSGYKTLRGAPARLPENIRRALETQGYYRDTIKENEERLIVPVRLREQILGFIEVNAPKLPADISEVLSALSERLALAAENIRLVEEARERAEKESKINTFSAKLAGSVSLQSILRLAVEQMGEIIPGSEITLQLIPDENLAETETESGASDAA